MLGLWHLPHQISLETWRSCVDFAIPDLLHNVPLNKSCACQTSPLWTVHCARRPHDADRQMCPPREDVKRLMSNTELLNGSDLRDLPPCSIDEAYCPRTCSDDDVEKPHAPGHDAIKPPELALHTHIMKMPCAHSRLRDISARVDIVDGEQHI